MPLGKPDGRPGQSSYFPARDDALAIASSFLTAVGGEENTCRTIIATSDQSTGTAMFVENHQAIDCPSGVVFMRTPPRAAASQNSRNATRTIASTSWLAGPDARIC